MRSDLEERENPGAGLGPHGEARPLLLLPEGRSVLGRPNLGSVTETSKSRFKGIVPLFFQKCIEGYFLHLLLLSNPTPR